MHNLRKEEGAPKIESWKEAVKFVKQIIYVCLRIVPDDLYLKIFFRVRTGKKLDIKNPKTFNEKLQWLKLYNRKKEYTLMSDKYAVRSWIENRLSAFGLQTGKYLPSLYGVYKEFDEIDFAKLPDSFVLKTNHDSGTVILVKNKSELDIRAARKLLTRNLKRNYYWYGREWGYKNISPPYRSRAVSW